MKDEALKLALEALENSVDLVREDAYNAEKLYGNYPSRQGKIAGLKVLADDHEKAITAIKQALAAPVQSCYCPNCEAMGKELAALKAQPAPVQEPVMEYPDYTPGVGWRNVTPPVQPAVPDAMTSADIQEHIEYVAGWNDCRQAMMEMMK
jgi:hypothetical protein